MDLLSDRQVAALLGLAPNTLRHWRCRAHGPAWVRVGARTIRYERAEVERWLAARRQAGD